MKKSVIVWGVLLTLTYNAFSQSRLLLHHFGRDLAYTNMLNPAIKPKHKVVLGLPIISGIHAGFSNSGIAYKDIFSYDENNTLRLDTAGLPDKLRRQHQIRINAELQMLYLGIRIKKKHYFSLGVHTILEQRLYFPKELISWVIRGPLDHRSSSTDIHLKSIVNKTLAYNQFSLGYSYDINEKFSAGIRIKYLMGIMGADIMPTSGKVHLGLDALSIETNQPIVAHTSGIHSIIENPTNPSNWWNPNNAGFAIDIGGEYRFNKRLSLSASVTDLGFITWKNNNHAYQIAPGKYTFTGTDLLSALKGSLVDFSVVKQEANKLVDELNIKEVTGKPFTTSLIGKVYMGADYQIYKNHSLKAALYMDFFRGRINPAFGIGYHMPVSKVLTGIVGLSYQNGQINNIGLGMSITLGPAQLYVASDHVNSTYYPSRLSQTNLQVGLNLVFNEEKPVKPKQYVITEPIIADTAIQKISTIPIEPMQNRMPIPLTLAPRGEKNTRVYIDYYIVVGAFQLRSNAIKYSQKIKKIGLENHFDFLTNRHIYYIYLYKFRNDLKATREKVNEIRQMNKFLLPKTWILPVPIIE